MGKGRGRTLAVVLVAICSLAIALVTRPALASVPDASCAYGWKANTEGTTNSGAASWSGVKALVHTGSYAASGEDCIRVSSVWIEQFAGSGEVPWWIEIGWFIG